MPTTTLGEEGADSPEQIQWDAGKGDCAGCDCGFLLRTAAEISVMASPIGKGSMNVIAALRSGLSSISLYFFTCSICAWMAARPAPEALSFSIIWAPYLSMKSGRKLKYRISQV